MRWGLVSLEDAAHQHSATAAMAMVMVHVHSPPFTCGKSAKASNSMFHLPSRQKFRVDLSSRKNNMRRILCSTFRSTTSNNHASCNCNMQPKGRGPIKVKANRDDGCRMQAPLTTSPGHQAPDARSSPLLVPAYCYRIYRSASSNDMNVK